MMSPEESSRPASRASGHAASSDADATALAALDALSRVADAVFAASDMAAVSTRAAAALCSALDARFAAVQAGADAAAGIATAAGVTLNVAEREQLARACRAAGERAVDVRDVRLTEGDGAALERAGGVALVTVPISLGADAHAAAVIGLGGARRLTAESRALLLAAAKLIGHAYQRARLAENERAVSEGIGYMERGARLLGETTDRAKVLHQLARLALPRLGDYAVIDEVDGVGAAREAGLAHVDPDREALLREYRERYPVRDAGPDSPLEIAKRTRRPVVRSGIRRDELVALARSEDQLQMLQRLQPSAYIVVPLMRFGQVLGTMSFGICDDHRVHTTEDVVLASVIGDRVSSVLHSMRLLARSERARADAEAAAAELHVQTEELSRTNEALQDQAIELEQQAEEAQALSEELEETMDELRQSEGRFRALIDAAAQAVWRADADGARFIGSPSWDVLSGHPIDRGEVVHPDDRDRTHAAWMQAMAAGTSYEIEHRLRVNDGRFRWFQARAVPIHDQAGSTVREWIGMHTDIHARKLVEAEQELMLRVSAILQSESDGDRIVQRTLAVLAEHLGVAHARMSEIDVAAGIATLRGSHVVDAEGRTPAGAAPVQFRLADVSNDTEQAHGSPLVVNDTATDPRTAAMHDMVYAKRGVRATVSVPLLRGGQWVASLSVASAEPRVWEDAEVALIRRVGDKLWPAFEAARAYNELATSQARLAGVVDSAMDAIISVDDQGRIGVFNLAAERVFGVAAHDAIGSPIDRFLVSADGDHGADPLAAVGIVPGQNRRAVEVVGRRGDGVAFPAELTASEMANDAGRQLTIVLRDVTERRALESQLLQAQKMEAVGRLAGGVAHDFNNILMVISSCAEFLRESIAEDDERRVDVDEVLAATTRASGLTRQLLTFSRKQVVVPHVLDVNQVVRDLEPMLRRLIGEEIELAVVASQQRAAVRADLGQLEQVLVNLAVNARDAMPGGGILGVETDVVHIDADEARALTTGRLSTGVATRPGEYIVLRVTDTGMGIAPALLDQVFEPFFTTKAVGHGTGLGLAMVHGIVSQAGGQVRVHSVPSEGAAFEVLLPRVRGADSGEYLPLAQERAARGTGTILVVEDEVTVRRSLRRMLTRAGYRVMEARHGADALLVWRESQGEIDLLLTDLRMPELGGRELVAALHAQRPDLPVIAMSGYPPDSSSPAEEDWRTTERFQFLAKPFSSEVLLSAVATMLGARTE